MNEKKLDESYFRNRNLNDELRIKSFELEKQLVKKYKSSGRLLDVGCSTGEMIDYFDWDGEAYGMEIVDYAIEQAKKRNINFEKNLLNSKDFFDVIIFRGTIQHIDTPYLYIQKALQALKSDGYLIFLATPNANSIYFKIWNTLPFLDMPKVTYLIPHNKWFIQSIENFGFKLVEERYPYISSPYSNLLFDHIKFLIKLIGCNVKFPFWKNSMELVFKKT